jgi:hypothetical protein
MITRLEADNALNIPQLDVAYMGWLNRPQKGKSHGLIVVEFRSLVQANFAIVRLILWDGQKHGAQKYDRACRRKQCYKCHKYGHLGTQCQLNKQLCGICAGENHTTKDCPNPKQKKCAACQGAHTSKDPRCPKRQKEDHRVTYARLHSTKF